MSLITLVAIYASIPADHSASDGAEVPLRCRPVDRTTELLEGANYERD